MALQTMSKIAAIRKQIAALEAQAARLTQIEMKAAVAKVRGLMDSLGVTLEHLGMASSTRAPRKGSPAKKMRAKRAGAGAAKYADPKTGKTWSGFGRVPAWIASAKNRDLFLVDRAATHGVEAAEAPTPKKRSAKAVSKAGKAAAKTAPAAKKAAPAKKATSAKKAVPAKTAAAKKSLSSKAAAEAAPAESAGMKPSASKKSPAVKAKTATTKPKAPAKRAAKKAATGADERPDQVTSDTSMSDVVREEPTS